jgi:tetratricopeptide (TPR) repeat protein
MQRLVRGELEQDRSLAEPFWVMIFLATEWIPENRWFLEIGIIQSKKEKNDAALVKMLQIGLIRFPDEIFFYREAYHLKFEQGDLADAMGLIRDLVQRFPDDLEPVYYGLRTTLYLPGEEFNTFRKAAERLKMPGHVLCLLDYAYAFLRGRRGQATLCLDEFQRKYPSLNYYSDMLRFVTTDIPPTEKGVNAAVFTSVDHFCKRMLKIGDA